MAAEVVSVVFREHVDALQLETAIRLSPAFSRVLTPRGEREPCLPQPGDSGSLSTSSEERSGSARSSTTLSMPALSSGAAAFLPRCSRALHRISLRRLKFCGFWAGERNLRKLSRELSVVT